MSLFCEWWRAHRDLTATFAAAYAAGRARLASRCPRAAVLEVL